MQQIVKRRIDVQHAMSTLLSQARRASGTINCRCTLSINRKVNPVQQLRCSLLRKPFIVLSADTAAEGVC